MLAGTIENVLNRALPRSVRAQQLCAELTGRRIAIEVSELMRLLVESTGDSLRVSQSAAPADAEIIGGPLGLLALGGNSPQAVLQRRGVEIRGDAAVAERFRELGMLLRPDLEEEFSGLVGDVPAHQLARFARLGFSWSRRAAATAVQNVAEYLANERRDLVSRNEGEPFLRAVDALREDVDRLEARLSLLTRA
jgi:ubiquinone biosynthesis protein UbiJ